MWISWSTIWFLSTIFLTLINPSFLSNVGNLDYPSGAKPPVSWFISPSYLFNFSWPESVGVKPILAKGNFICGFHCTLIDENCFFAVSIFNSSFDVDHYSLSPTLVWSANRNDPLELEATLRFTEDGDLILQDGNGSLIWSTNTAAKSVSGLNLTNEGNLVLFDKNNNAVWQSFDHPTNSLVRGQGLVSGQKLRSSLSETNWSEGLYSFSIDDNGNLVAYLETNPPQIYYSSPFVVSRNKEGEIYAKFQTISNMVYDRFDFTRITLESDGHLRGYKEIDNSNLTEALDFYPIDSCDYPLSCGIYGICLSFSPDCRCPEEAAAPGEKSYFSPRNYTQMDLGCSPKTPIACEYSHDQSFLELLDVDYVALTLATLMNNTDIDNCKQACLKNCSCKAIIYQQYDHFLTFGRMASEANSWVHFAMRKK